MNQCFERLAEIWPVAERPKLTTGMVFGDVTFDERNPATGVQHDSASDEPKKPKGIEYPTEEAKSLVGELMVLCEPITRERLKAIFPQVPHKHRDDIAQMFELTLLKSVLEFDPAMGYQFTTKHRSDLQGTWGNTFKWLARQHRSTGREITFTDEAIESGGAADRIAQGAEAYRYFTTGQSGYDDPTASPGDDTHFVTGIIRRAIDLTRQRLVSGNSTDADRARLVILDKRILAPAHDEEPVTLQKLADDTGVSKERVRQHEATLMMAIANNAADICVAEHRQITAEDLKRIAAYAQTALSEVPPSQRNSTYQEAKRKIAQLDALMQDGPSSPMASR